MVMLDSEVATGSSSLLSLRRRFLPLIHLASDLAVWILAIVGGTWIRYEFRLDLVARRDLAEVILFALVAHVAVGGLVGLYRRRWRYGSFEEAIAVAATYAVSGAIVASWSLLLPSSVPRSVPLISTAFAGLMAVAGRSMWRLWSSRSDRPIEAAPVVVIGAGDTAAQIVRGLLSSRTSRFVPVALVDDDPLKRRLRIMGVPVAGELSSLSAVCSTFGASVAVLAVPSASQRLRREVARMASEAGIELFTSPSLDDLLIGRGDASASELRPVTEEDLLGRPPAEIDPEEIAAYIRGARVLVTGAGGSIGSEICRTLARFEPADLVMLDRDESGLHATQLSIDGRAMLESPSLRLVDLRDEEATRRVFEEVRPRVVFHAAALKHLPLLEMYPEEAWKSNVVATQSLLTLALEFGVECFVNVSTDKAADPTSVLGRTKRIGERLTADAALRVSGVSRFISVRFGNVLGSRGSVLTAFEAQLRNGGPITVTHPDVTRYFMTIEEAARLTVYAGAVGRPGEVLVLDMGEPVRILDVARRFSRRAEPPLDIAFTSLRPGEKVHEVLFGSGELDSRPIHPLISHVDVPPLTWERCQGAQADDVREVISAVLADGPRTTA
ncbi:MAG: polysaccharide biosynthesis protein [Candidatus Nanopelagicales bacterium]|nr:polysaccharide biosynthesis protein [Candidatus Nanopelagicales bacterium]